MHHSLYFTLFASLILYTAIFASVQQANATVASAEACAQFIVDESGVELDWFDANGDEIIDVADVVALMNQVIGINVTDLSWVYSQPYLIDFRVESG